MICVNYDLKIIYGQILCTLYVLNQMYMCMVSESVRKYVNVPGLRCLCLYSTATTRSVDWRYSVLPAAKSEMVTSISPHNYK